MAKVLNFCQHPKEEGFYWMWSFEEPLSWKPRIYYVYSDVDWFASTISSVGTFTIKIDQGSKGFSWYGPLSFPVEAFDTLARVPAWDGRFKKGDRIKVKLPGCEEENWTHDCTYITYVPETAKHLITMESEYCEGGELYLTEICEPEDDKNTD